jgi:integrase
MDSLPTKADAERAAEHLRMQINSQHPVGFHSLTMRGLVDRYLTEYAARRVRKHTLQVYGSLLHNHVLPRWGSMLIKDIRPMMLDDWLQSYPSSVPVRAHIKGLLHALFAQACRWELVDSNVVDKVGPISSKRLKTPRRLSPIEIRAIAEQLPEPIKTMWLVAACTGLRSCELVALQWADLDFEQLSLTVQRSFVQGQINGCKTEASAAVLPLDLTVAGLLRAHQERSRFVQPIDYVFAGEFGQPRWASEIVKNYIKPAAVRAGVVGSIGWHSLRHSYSTLLRAKGVDIKVQQSLLRHAQIATTMDVYTAAATDQQKSAAGAVASELLQVVPTRTSAVQ